MATIVFNAYRPAPQILHGGALTKMNSINEAKSKFNNILQE